MLFLDVNIVVHAFRSEQSEEAAAVRAWLEPRLTEATPVALSELVLASGIRITTRPGTFERPSTSADAVTFMEELLAAPAAQVVRPGPRHWATFIRLVSDLSLRGNDVQDAYLASLCMEHGATMVSRDRGFRRFDGLRILDPLA